MLRSIYQSQNNMIVLRLSIGQIKREWRDANENLCDYETYF